MSDVVLHDLLLEHMNAMRTQMSRMEQRLDDVAGDVRALRSRMSGFMQTDLVRESQVAQLAMRVDRIERRLDLSDQT